MELKEATYKNTEIGLIPEDWSITSLGKVGLFSKGKGIKKDEVQSDGIPCVRYGELYTKYDNIISSFHSYISEEVSNASIQIKEGDILFAGSGETREEIGKCAALLYTEKVYAGGDIIILRPNGYDSTFLGYLLNAPIIAKQKSIKGQGDAVVHIYSSGLSNVKIPVPPPEEQQAIATALSDVDTLITNLDKLIAKKKAIKQGAMQRLLKSPAHGGQRLPGFEGEWINKTLDKVSSSLVRGPFGGALKKEFFVHSGYKVYEQRNAIYATVDLGNYFINEDKFKELQRFEVKAGDFIVSCSGTIGRIYQIPENHQKGVINQALLKITINSSEIDEKYFFYQFTWDHFQNKVIDDTQGGAMKNLVGMDKFKKAEIPCPPSLDEQKAIANVLTDMDKAIEAIESKKSKYLRIKQGMMQELLTGKTRLV